MKINEFFQESYLTAGGTYDNWIFESCPNEVLFLATESLCVKVGEVVPCVIYLDRKTEELVERTINSCDDDFQKKILARDFIIAAIMNNLLKATDNEDALKLTALQLNAFMSGDVEAAKKLHVSSFMPYDVTRLASKIGKIEMTFILNGTKNRYLQQSINLFVAAREPYSVKIFTNNYNLPSYYDLNGNIIESPHDFMRRNISDYIEHEEQQ